MNARSANTGDGILLDICARGFTKTSSNRLTDTSCVYKRHEQAKKREYGQHIREVEHGVFTPLVLSCTYRWYER